MRFRPKSKSPRRITIDSRYFNNDFRRYLAVALWLVVVVLPAACARAPVPTSDQPTATRTGTATATRALPAATVAVPVPTQQTAPVPVTATGIPLPTIAATPFSTLPPSTSQPEQTVIAYDRDSRGLLLEADVTGGLSPVPRGAHVPTFRLYGDGLVVFAGERTPLSTGLDAVVRIGYLSDSTIQGLLGYLNEVGFFSLNAFYQPRPTPPDLVTERITVYLTNAKTVRVYGPGVPGTPQSFSNAFARIAQTVPADAKIFTPADGYLVSQAAGSAADFRAAVFQSWPTEVGIRLVDATDGVVVSGSAYSNIAGLVARTSLNTLYREGDRVYRVQFSPNLPRAVHLTDWIGTILEAPREFDGRVFDIVGYFRGRNLLGEARGSGPTRNDWVIMDDGGAMFVTGPVPSGLESLSRADAWSIVRLRAAVVYVRSGTSYLEARRVETVLSNPSSTQLLIPNLEAAVAAVKSRFPEVAKVQSVGPGVIGATTDIKSLERGDGWDLVFIERWGDCPSGCMNDRYVYFSVKKDGRVQKVGEFSRVFNSASNSFDTIGTSLWNVPK